MTLQQLPLKVYDTKTMKTSTEYSQCRSEMVDDID